MVRRADSSGTTFVFTTHLAAISDEWKKGPGVGTTVKWPASDKFVASPKNDGVAATLRQTPGSIGYVEYAFAKFAKLEMAQLQNKAGQFVAPGGKGGEEALASVKLPPDLRAWLPDPEGAQAYPIATYTWLLLYKKNSDPKKAAALRELVDYCLTEGQKMSAQMGYIPLPGGRRRRREEGGRERPVTLGGASGSWFDEHARARGPPGSGRGLAVRLGLLRGPRCSGRWPRPRA